MFLSVKFSPHDQRAYTYSYKGDRVLAPGDFVAVETKDGMKLVEVVAFDLPEPPFACKPVKATLELVEVPE